MNRACSLFDPAAFALIVELAVPRYLRGVFNLTIHHLKSIVYI